jgi:Ca2+-binding RTX toxin-like protein
VVVNAEDGSDSVFVQAAPTGGLTVNGGTGTDAVEVDFGALAGAVTVNGGSEADSLRANGTAGSDTLVLAAASVVRGSESVGYTGVEDLTVDAKGGADLITVNGTGPVTTVLGGAGDDDFVVNAVAAAGITLNGQGDSDDYTVNFGALAGVVNVADAPVGVFDRLFVNGTSGGDVLLIAPAFVKRNGTETVNYSGIEELNVDAGDGDDDITVDGTSVPTTVLGGAGEDDFVVIATGSLAPLTLDGQEDSDTYAVNLGSLLSPVVIADSGLIGVDSLLINGTPGDDVIILTDGGVGSGTESVTFSGIEQFIVDAGAGNDLVDGSALTISVTIYGGTGDDTLIGGSNDDTIYGEEDNDDLIGNLGDDYLDGGAGSDGLVGDQGTIVRVALDGSTATTLAIPSGKLSAVINEAGIRRDVTLIDEEVGGDDTLIGGDGDDFAHGGAGDDVVDGGAGADALFGNSGNDAMAGGTGDDHLYGGAGNDSLDGNEGADIAYGGDGDDRLVADQSGDKLIDWFGNFNDFVVPGPGYGSPTIVRSPSPWVQNFLLNLARDDGAMNPNAEIRVVVPGSSLQQSNSGPGGRV